MEVKVYSAMLIVFLGVTLGDQDHHDTGLVLVDNDDEKDSDLINQPSIVRLDRSFKDDEEYNSEPFIPTKEWQVVKKGQSVPAGLHIRMNFQTHIREAKLLDADDSSRLKHLHRKDENEEQANYKKTTIVAQPEASGQKIVSADDLRKDHDNKDSGRLYFTKNQLKEALKNFRDKFHDDDLKPDEQDITRAEAVKKKFRSIEEIRKELQDTAGMQIKSDAQIMKLKVEVLKASNSTEREQLNALEDLEYYVHQIDNAVDLEKINGLEVVLQYLNQSTTLLQEKAAQVIGSAVQSNPVAQASALQHGAMPLLLRLISFSSHKCVRKTALFALSALTRTHSPAQVAFLKLDGLSHVLRVFNSKDSAAIKLKVITLISDLIIEQEDVRLKMVKNSEMQAEKRAPLMSALVAQGWCELLATQLDPSDSSKDRAEKMLSAIVASASSCKTVFISNNLKGKLTVIRKQYEKEIEKEDDPDFENYLRTFPAQIDKILHYL